MTDLLHPVILLVESRRFFSGSSYTHGLSFICFYEKGRRYLDPNHVSEELRISPKQPTAQLTHRVVVLRRRHLNGPSGTQRENRRQNHLVLYPRQVSNQQQELLRVATPVLKLQQSAHRNQVDDRNVTANAPEGPQTVNNLQTLQKRTVAQVDLVVRTTIVYRSNHPQHRTNTPTWRLLVTCLKMTPVNGVPALRRLQTKTTLPQRLYRGYLPVWLGGIRYAGAKSILVYML